MILFWSWHNLLSLIKVNQDPKDRKKAPKKYLNNYLMHKVAMLMRLMVQKESKLQSKVQRKSNYFLGHLEWASLLSNVRIMTLCFSSRAKLLSIEKEESCHPSSDSWYALSSPTSTSQPQQSLLNWTFYQVL